MCSRSRPVDTLRIRYLRYFPGGSDVTLALGMETPVQNFTTICSVAERVSTTCGIVACMDVILRQVYSRLSIVLYEVATVTLLHVT